MVRKQTLRQISICWYFFVIGVILGNWAVIIPLVKDHHNINNGELGGIMVGVVFGAICVIPIVTKLIEKYGSAITVCIGSVILVLFFPIIGIPGNIGILIAGMVMLGFSAGFMDISMNGQAVLFEKATNNHHLGLFTSIYAIGNLFGALIGGIMIGPLNLSVLVQCLVLSGVLLLPSILFVFGLFPYSEEIEITKNTPITGTDHRGRDGDTMVSFNSPSDLSKPLTDSTPSSSSLNDIESSSETSTTTVYSRTLLIVSALSFGAYFGEGSVGDWSAIYLSNHDASNFQASFGVVVFQLFIAIGRFYSDYLVLSIGRIKLLKLSGILSAIGLIIVSISPIFLSTSFNLYLIVCIIGFGCSGCGLSVVYPTCISIAGNCISGMKTSEAIAFVSSIGYVGVMVGPPVLGGLSLVISLQYSFLFDGAILALMTVLAFFLESS